MKIEDKKSVRMVGTCTNIAKDKRDRTKTKTPTADNRANS